MHCLKTTLGILIIISLLACRKEVDSTNDLPRITPKTETLIIKNFQLLEYDLGPLGDEDGARIIIEPKNAMISELSERDFDEGKKYRYKPKFNFKGEDYVEISIGRSPGGGYTSYDIIKLTFVVK